MTIQHRIYSLKLQALILFLFVIYDHYITFGEGGGDDVD